MTSEAEAQRRAQQRRKEQRSNSIKRIRAQRAEQDGAPLGESTFIEPSHKRETGPTQYRRG